MVTRSELIDEIVARIENAIPSADAELDPENSEQVVALANALGVSAEAVSDLIGDIQDSEDETELEEDTDAGETKNDTPHGN